MVVVLGEIVKQPCGNCGEAAKQRVTECSPVTARVAVV